MYSSPYTGAVLVTRVKLKSLKRGTYRNLVINYSLISVVACTVEVESVNINSVLWSFVNFFDSLSFQYRETILQLVDWNLVLAGVGLQNTGQEALREEQTGDPV